MQIQIETQIKIKDRLTKLCKRVAENEEKLLSHLIKTKSMLSVQSKGNDLHQKTKDEADLKTRDNFSFQGNQSNGCLDDKKIIAPLGANE